MKLKNFDSEIAYQLLMYLADNETFPSLAKFKEVKKSEVAEMLKEIAQSIKQSAQAEATVQRTQLDESDLSAKTMSVLSQLSPKEEMILFKTFKLV